MWTRTYTQHTTADPARLWELLSDVNGWGTWNDGIDSITLDGPLAVGASFAMAPPGEEPVTSTIVALEPPRLISDNTDFHGVAIRVDHRLETAAAGTTITFDITVSGDLPDEDAKQIGEGVSADFPDVLRKLAASATAPSAP